MASALVSVNACYFLLNGAFHFWESVRFTRVLGFLSIFMLLFHQFFSVLLANQDEKIFFFLLLQKCIYVLTSFCVHLSSGKSNFKQQEISFVAQNSFFLHSFVLFWKKKFKFLKPALLKLTCFTETCSKSK